VTRPSSIEDSVVYPHEVPAVDDRRPYGPPPPRIGLWEALRRKWLLVAVVLVLFVGAGVAIGLNRSPTYTAESRLSVGRLDVSAPGAVSGFALATQALASQYSRVVYATPVLERVGREVGASPREVGASIVATPIPSSPVLSIEAEATSEREAVALASAASEALAAYVTKLNRSNPDSARLLKAYKEANLALNRRRAEEAIRREKAAAKETAATRDALVKAQTRTQTADLRAETLRTAYQASQQAQSATALLQVMSRPSSASSDRWSVLQLYAFIGFAAACAVGLAIAVRATQRETRRALAG
jgi:capsular polysaccharide biosynthesis protein